MKKEAVKMARKAVRMKFDLPQKKMSTDGLSTCKQYSASLSKYFGGAEGESQPGGCCVAQDRS